MAAAKSKKTGDGGGKNPSAAQKKNKKLNSAQATIEKDLKDGKPRAKKIVEKLADEAGVCDTKGASGGKAAGGSKKAASGKSQGKKGKSDGGKAKSDGGKAKSSGKAAGGKAKSDGGKAKSASGKTKSASSGKAAAASKPAAKKASGEGSKAKKAVTKKADKKTSSGKAAGAKSASGKSQSKAASGKKAAGGKGKSGKSASKKTSSAKADKKKTQQTKSGASMADSKKPKGGKGGKSGKGKSASAKSKSASGKGGKGKSKKPQSKPMATTTAADQRLRQATGNTSAELAEVGKLAREKAAGKKYRPSGRTRPVQKDPSLNASERRFAKNNDVPIGVARSTLKETTKPGHKYQNNPVDLYRGPTSLARTAGHASTLMANPVDYVKNPVENWKPVVLGVSLTALGYVGMNFIDRGLATMGSGKCDAFHGSDAAARILQKPGALRLGVQLGTSLVAGGGAWWLSMREKEHPYAVAALVGLATGAGTHFLAALLTSYAMPALFKADKWESDKMGSRYYPLEQERFQKGLSKLIDTQTKICESKKLNSDERLDLVFGVVMAAADAPDKLSTQEKAEKFLRVPNHRLFGAGKPQQRQGGNVGVAGAPQDGAPPREKYMPARTPDRMGQQGQQNQVRQQQGQQQVGVAGTQQQQKGTVLPPPPVPGRQAPAVKSGQAPQNKPGHTHPEGQVGVAGCGACSRPAMSAQPSQKRPAWYMVKAGKTTGADGVERTIEAGMWLDAEGHPLYKGPAPMLEEAKKRGAYTFEAASGNYLDEAGNVLFTVPRRNRTNEERAQQPAAQATSKASQRIEVPANAKPVLVKEGGRTFIDFSTEAGASASAAPSGAASAASSAPSASATLNFEKIQQQMERLEAQHQQTKKELVEFAAKNENLAKDNIELRAKIRTYEERLGTGSTEIAAPVARVVSEITPEGPRSVQNDAPSASTPSFRRSDNGRSGLFGRN